MNRTEQIQMLRYKMAFVIFWRRSKDMNLWEGTQHALLGKMDVAQDALDAFWVMKMLLYIWLMLFDNHGCLMFAFHFALL